MVEISLANNTHWTPFFPWLSLLKCDCRHLWWSVSPRIWHLVSLFVNLGYPGGYIMLMQHVSTYNSHLQAKDDCCKSKHVALALYFILLVLTVIYSNKVNTRMLNYRTCQLTHRRHPVQTSVVGCYSEIFSVSLWDKEITFKLDTQAHHHRHNATAEDDACWDVAMCLSVRTLRSGISSRTATSRNVGCLATRHSFTHSSIPLSVLQQIHSLFHNEFSRLRSSAPSFNFQHPLLSLRLSISRLRLFLVFPSLPSIFPSMTCFITQLLWKMWPIQLSHLPLLTMTARYRVCF